MNDKYKTIIYYLTIIITFIIGIFFRTTVLGYRDCFEDDECRLLIAIMDKNYLQLFLPIGYAQSAPPFYLIILKFFGSICKYIEQLLKLVPYIFSIISMVLFYKLSIKCLSRRISIILANFLFSINAIIIHFSSIIKQYSTDVFVCLLLTLLFSSEKIFNIKNTNQWKVYLLIIFIPFISLPGTFFVCAYLTLSIINNIRDIAFLKKLFLFLLTFGLIMSIYTYYNLLPSKFLLNVCFPDYWVDGFINNFSDLIRIPVSFIRTTFFPNTYTLFNLILFIAGIYCALKQKSNIYNIIILSFIIANIAAAVKIYPLIGRIGLYFVPYTIILCTKPLDCVNIKSLKFALIIICLGISYSAYNVNYFSKIISDKTYFCNYSPKLLMNELISRYNKDETIILNKASGASYAYYSMKNGFYTSNVIEISSDDLTEKLESLPSNKKYWFYLIKDYRGKRIFPKINEFINTQTIIYAKKDKDSLLYLIKK